MIEPRHLRVLREVSRTGSYSAAARELGISQPAVSQQMKALEQTAGTPLVVRSGRSTRLTEAGQALNRHATAILAGLTAAEEEVAAIVGLHTGRVRLVSFPSASSAVVPAALAGMRSRHPGTRVFLEEAEPPRSVELLRTGEADVALAFRHLSPEGPGGAGPGRSQEARRDAGAVDDGGAAEWDDLVVRPLLTERLVTLVPAGHPLAPPRAVPPAGAESVVPGRGSVAAPGGPECVRPGDLAGDSGATDAAPVALAAFEDESWIAGCPRCRRHLVDVCRDQGFTPRIDHATDDSAAVAGLVGAGVGVALMPELALRSLRLRDVAVVPVDPPAGRQVVALTLPDLARVPAVERLLDALAAAGAAAATPRGR